MSCFVPNLFVSCVGFYISYNQHGRFLLRTKVEQFRFSSYRRKIRPGLYTKPYRYSSVCHTSHLEDCVEIRYRIFIIDLIQEFPFSTTLIYYKAYKWTLCLNPIFDTRYLHFSISMLIKFNKSNSP